MQGGHKELKAKNISTENRVQVLVRGDSPEGGRESTVRRVYHLSNMVNCKPAVKEWRVMRVVNGQRWCQTWDEMSQKDWDEVDAVNQELTPETRDTESNDQLFRMLLVVERR